MHDTYRQKVFKFSFIDEFVVFCKPTEIQCEIYKKLADDYKNNNNGDSSNSSVFGRFVLMFRVYFFGKKIG